MKNTVFISYKHSIDGMPTEDSKMAKELYGELVRNGINTFFADKTLLEVGADGYKEQIDAELDVCLILVVVGTSVDNMMSGWVKYEWNGFQTDILNGCKKGKIFTYVDNINPHDLPRALRGVQSFDRKKDSLGKIVEFIKNAIVSLEAENNDSGEIYNKIVNDERENPPVLENPFAARLLKKFKTISNVFTLLDLDYLPSKSPVDSFDLNDLVQIFQEEKEEKFLSTTSIIYKQVRCIIYGEGGSGKTTFLQHKAFEVSSELIDNNIVFPLYIRLAECDEDTFASINTLLIACNKSIYEICFDEICDIFKNKKLILFLDGLDEYSVDNNMKTSLLFESINKFSLEYDCSVIITCRTKYLPENTSYQKYKISPLSNNLIKEFIKRYFDFLNINMNPDKFLSLLPREVLALTTSPLILSMVVAQYYMTKSIPSNKDELYEKIMTQLLKKKPIISDELLQVGEKFYLLCYLAFSILLSGKLSFNYFDAIKVVDERNSYNLPSTKILDDFIHSGILSKNDNFVSFFHSSVLEFFSSQEINKEYSFVAKASMDQYFLRNEQKIDRIIRCIRPSDNDEIIEIGAGIGTVSLQLNNYKKLYLVDLDEGLCKILNYNFRHRKNCEIIQDDAIKMLQNLRFNKVISNLPFFLTKDVLRALETVDFQIAVMSIK